MQSARVVCIALVFTVSFWALGAEAHRNDMEMRERAISAGSPIAPEVKGEIIWETGFEPGDLEGTNFDYNEGSSPDDWHITKRMRYHYSGTWMTAHQDSYFCHIGDDTTGYSDGNDVGYQIELDLSNYSDVSLFYWSAMEAYSNGDFDKFAVWGWAPGLGDTLINLDPGEGYAWGGDWGPYWYPPDTPDSLISLDALAGQSGVVIEFWFYSGTGMAQGFGVAIDKIVISGTPLTSVEGGGQEVSLPGDFALAAPYPNPFNASTSIRYQVPAGEVQIGIYNVSGQLVRTLAQGFVTAGSHTLSWDGRDAGGADVESGIYFCQLRSQQGSVTRKMVLLR